MFDEVFSSIRNSLRERITSPLLGTFAIAWAIWNYRFLAVLFSEIPYHEKFSYIDSELYAGDFINRFLCQFVLPIISTLLFIWLYPILSKYVYRYWRTKQKEMREIRLQVEKETLLSVEESRKLLGEMISLERRFENELAGRDQEIRQLKDAIQAGSNTTEMAEEFKPDQLQTLDQELSKLDGAKISVLKVLAEDERSDRRSYESRIESRLVELGFDLVAARLALEELSSENFISHQIDRRTRDYYWELKTKGRRAALAVKDVEIAG